MENREELIRLARESGLPVPEEASLTEIIQFISATPDISAELSEALNHILSSTTASDD